MKLKLTKFIESIIAIVLFSFLTQSVFATAVSSDESVLEKTTLESLGETSAYTLKSGTSGTYITKFLTSPSDDSFTFTPKYYTVDIASKVYGSETYLFSQTYYWQEDGTISTNVTDNEAFSVNYNYNESYNKYYNERQTSYGNYTWDFYGISSEATNGGALYYTGTIEGYTISSNFVKNTLSSSANDFGGALSNSGVIYAITGDFISNTDSSTGISYGGALYNKGTITSIDSNFIANEANTGAGIMNGSGGTITSIGGSFIGNISSNQGGGIYNGNYTGVSSTIGEIEADFIGNSATNGGGAIYNVCANVTIGSITGDFINNYSTIGGAIVNATSATIGTIDGDFIGNTASKNAGAIANYGGATIDSIKGDFIGNIASGNGGAIFNSSTIGSITGDFIGNVAELGAAIYNENGTLSLLALNDNIYFTANKTSTGVSSGIYNYATTGESNSTVNFNVYNSNSIVVNDAINGGSYANAQILNINLANLAEQTGASSYGTLELNNTVSNQTINLNNGSLKLGTYAGETLDINGSSITTSSSSGSLSNTDLVSYVQGGITIGEGVTIAEVFTNGSTLSLDFSIEALEETYNFMYFEDSSDIEEMTVVLSDMQEAGTFTLVVDDQAYDTTEWTIVKNGDYLAVQAVPEASTYALIMGIISFGFIAYKRRKVLVK